MRYMHFGQVKIGRNGQTDFSTKIPVGVLWSKILTYLLFLCTRTVLVSQKWDAKHRDPVT